MIPVPQPCILSCMSHVRRSYIYAMEQRTKLEKCGCCALYRHPHRCHRYAFRQYRLAAILQLENVSSITIFCARKLYDMYILWSAHSSLIHQSFSRIISRCNNDNLISPTSSFHCMPNRHLNVIYRSAISCEIQGQECSRTRRLLDNLRWNTEPTLYGSLHMEYLKSRARVFEHPSDYSHRYCERLIDHAFACANHIS